MTERDEAIRLRAELAREQANIEVLTEATALYCRERNYWQERAMQAETQLDYAKADLEVVKAERDAARDRMQALSRHRHTDACLAYAAQTGRAFCIAECADAYAAIAEAADPFREAETLEIMRQQYTAIYALMRDATGDTSRFPSLADWVRSLVDEAQAQLTSKRGATMTEQGLTVGQTIEQVIAAYLKERGYDGLFAPGECGCLLDNLCPCGEWSSIQDCIPGYKTLCTCGEHDYHVGERDE